MSRPVMPIYFSQEDEIKRSNSPFLEGTKETVKRISRTRGFYFFKNIMLLVILLFVIIVCIINLVNYGKVNSDYKKSKETYDLASAIYFPYDAETTSTSVSSTGPNFGSIMWNNQSQNFANQLYINVNSYGSTGSTGTNIEALTSIKTGDTFIIRNVYFPNSWQIWEATGDTVVNDQNSPSYVTVPVKSKGVNEFYNFSNNQDLYLALFNKSSKVKDPNRSVSESMLIFSIVANSFILLCCLVYSYIVIRDLMKGYNINDPGRIRKLVSQTVEGAKARADQAAEDVITKTQIDPDDINGSKAYLLSTLRFQIENNLDKYVNTMVNSIE